MIYNSNSNDLIGRGYYNLYKYLLKDYIPAYLEASRIISYSFSVSEGNLLIATTAGIPYFVTFSICFYKLHTPFFTNSTFSSIYDGSNFYPGLTLGPPPCNFNALTVATIIAIFGLRPLYRHLIFINFSIPISAPKPAYKIITSLL